MVDCSQSPIFQCDRRDRVRLTVNGGHLDFTGKSGTVNSLPRGLGGGFSRSFFQGLQDCRGTKN